MRTSLAGGNFFKGLTLNDSMVNKTMKSGEHDVMSNEVCDDMTVHIFNTYNLIVYIQPHGQ